MDLVINIELFSYSNFLIFFTKEIVSRTRCDLIEASLTLYPGMTWHLTGSHTYVPGRTTWDLATVPTTQSCLETFLAMVKPLRLTYLGMNWDLPQDHSLYPDMSWDTQASVESSQAHSAYLISMLSELESFHLPGCLKTCKYYLLIRHDPITRFVPRHGMTWHLPSSVAIPIHVLRRPRRVFRPLRLTHCHDLRPPSFIQPLKPGMI